MLEIKTVYFGGRKGKDGKRKTAKNPKALYILFGFAYLCMMFGVFGLSMLLGDTMFPLHLDWMYFTIMIILAFLLGIFGSVMSTANSLFRSKDNELLLSMPIPPSKILFVRMIGVYGMGLIYECLIMIPVIVCYLIVGNVTFSGVVFSILMIFVLGFLIAAFSCGVGWIVSLIATKLKNQKILRVILIAVLIGVLYYFNFNATRIFSSIAQNAAAMAGNISGWLYPLYSGGLAMSGDILAFIIFAAMTAVLFLLAYYAISRSFAKIALTQLSEKKRTFRNTDIKSGNIQDALFKREVRRFISSVSYMLNCGLGMLLMLAGAVILIIKAEDVRNLMVSVQTYIPNADRLTGVAGASLVCMLTAFCYMAACSISLEGKSIWIYRSMPVDPYMIFKAKIMMHVILTGIPALLCVLAVGIVLKVNVVLFICMIVYVLMYIIFTASFELTMDMRKPKLDWTNENQVIKSSLGVFGETLAAMLLPIMIGSAYYLLSGFIGPEMYLVIFIAVFAVLTLLIHKWLAGRGREIFGTL